LWYFALTHNPGARHNSRRHPFSPVVGSIRAARRKRKPRRLKDEAMQYLPGFTVQCINPQCEARGRWLRADVGDPVGADGHCPNCGDFLHTVPPPLSPHFRMRPRPLTARPPLRPRPR
jgi:hypothetical protein